MIKRSLIAYSLTDSHWRMKPELHAHCILAVGIYLSATLNPDMTQPKRYTTYTIIGSLTYIFVIWLLHGVRPELPYDQSYVSNYLQGNLGWIAILVFFGNAYGAWVLPRALTHIGIAEKSLISRLLRIFAVGYAIAAVSMDAPAIHGIAAYMTFLSLPIAASTLWAQKRKLPGWQKDARISLILGLIQIWAMLFSWQAYGPFVGERILILSEIAWLVWLACIARKRLAPQH